MLIHLKAGPIFRNVLFAMDQLLKKFHRLHDYANYIITCKFVEPNLLMNIIVSLSYSTEGNEDTAEFSYEAVCVLAAPPSPL